jgi:ribonuclease HI
MNNSHNSHTIYTDGGSRGNPGPAASAFVAFDHEGNQIYQEGKFIGTATNNTAEYSALIQSLQWLNTQSIIPHKILYKLDSLLVVNQLKRLYKVKDQNILKLFNQVTDLMNTIPAEITFQHIPRDQNYLADALVNQTLDTR